MFNRSCPPHKFEARYDEKPSGIELGEFKGNSDAVRKLLFYNVYVRDICVKCGKVIEREDRQATPQSR